LSGRAGQRIATDLFVEASGIERIEPCAELRELVRRKLGHSLLKVFNAHVELLAQKTGVIEA
jgi:hypothetical protein